jgi:8-oxo-dGTP pyrophosphatase MutT (NUDIX family)
VADPSHPQPWPLLESTHDPELVLFRPRRDRVRNPRTGEALERVVLETPDWVNVVALTRGDLLVLVRQFRFGSGAVELEIPAGLVDDGETHEDAAKRELREETGYTAPSWTYLGACSPNPAFLDNLCHHWLAERSTRDAEPVLDPGEDIAVETVPLADVPALVAEGALRHALVLSALARVIDLRPPASS